MSVESKYTLLAQNQSSFPNNTTGYITPEILREFNIDMIDSLVDELSFQAYSGSVFNQIQAVSQSISSSVASLSQSVAISFSASNANVTALSTSVDSRLDNLEAFSSSLDATFATDAQLAAVSAALDSSKVSNSQTSSMAVSSSTYAITSSFALTASFALNAGGINTGSLVTTSSFNALTQSFNSYTQSTDAEINNLNTISASYLTFTQSYYTDSSSFSTRIDGITAGLGFVTTSSFNAYTQSISASIADLEFKDTTFITTGSTTATQYISGALVFTGSARISVSTASFFNDDSVGNDFLNLQYQPSGSAFSYFEAQTNLPQYLNQAVKVGTYTTGSIVGGMVKVVGNTSLIATGTSNEINPFGVLQVSQSVSSTNIKEWFGYNGNPQSNGEKAFLVQKGLHKVAGNGLGFTLAQAASYYIGAPIYWNGNSEGSMTITRPTDGRVLRLGYIASIQDDAANPYVRQIWFDPIWEQGETLYSPVFSGSVVLSNQANQFLAHITASSDSVGNIIFKTNTNTATTLLSGSANLLVNPTAPTAGFVRVIGSGSGNIALNPSNVPQISSSMAFPINMNSNYFGGNGTTFVSRGPISSSAWTINGNSILGTVNIGASATLQAEKIVNGFTMTGNQIAGTVSVIATQAALSGTLPVSLTNNNVNGGATLNLSSSAISMANNSINDSNFVLTNRFYSSSIGLGRVGMNTNTIGGASNQFIVSGSQLAGAQGLGAAFNQNIVLGSSNTIFINASESRISGTNVYHNALATGLIGQGLIVTGSSNASDAASFGSLFAGRHNAVDGIRDKTSDIVFAVGTGTSTTNKKTGFLIDSGSNTRIEGTLNISGSGNTTGSFDVSGSFTSSLETGKFYVGNASGRTETIATSSYVSNTTDTYTSTPAVQQIVTLTQSEWNSISGSSNSNTLYIIM
jgi:hypothetical protein